MNRLGPLPRGIAGGAGLVAVLGWVQLAPFSLLGTGNLALTYALIALSLVVLTGWVGQISLAQAAFVGVGAYVTAVVVRNWGVSFPFTLVVGAAAAGGAATLLGLVAVRVRGLYLAVATLIFAWMAQAYLFNQPWLAGVGGSSSAPVKPIGTKGRLPYLDFSSRITFYYVLLAITAAALIGVANLRDSKTGRAWFAVKGSEVAAASLGVAVTRYKLLAFATSGVIAGMAGSMVLTHQQVVTSTAFAPNVSLFYLAIAVVGGLTSLPGAVAGGVLFALLEELFFRVDALAGFLDIVSATLLAVVLLFFPAGLAGIPRALRPAAARLVRAAPVTAARRRAGEFLGSILARSARSHADGEPLEAIPAHALAPDGDSRGPGIAGVAARLVARVSEAFGRRGAEGAGVVVPDALATALAATAVPVPSPSPDAADPVHTTRGAPRVDQGAPDLVYTPGTATRPALPPRERRNVVLTARDVTVQFGGLTAVNNAFLEVREGEIVGLIGPNGAGKTTLFNAISGLNSPVSGTVELFGRDIMGLPVHERATRGMGRTFQLIQLFPELTVFDNLMVATHLRTPTGYLSHLFASGSALEAEAEARQRVRKVVELLRLEDVAGRSVAGLPFGILRMVEVARALVTGAPFVMLDEPASGLDNAETDRLADLLFWVRQTLGVSLLLIEHDVRMVTGVTDYMYVIDRGTMIAEGTPADVQRNPAVVAAYLGEPAGAAEGEGEPAPPGVAAVRV